MQGPTYGPFELIYDLLQSMYETCKIYWASLHGAIDGIYMLPPWCSRVGCAAGWKLPEPLKPPAGWIFHIAHILPLC